MPGRDDRIQSTSRARDERIQDRPAPVPAPVPAPDPDAKVRSGIHPGRVLWKMVEANMAAFAGLLMGVFLACALACLGILEVLPFPLALAGVFLCLVGTPVLFAVLALTDRAG